MAKKTEPAAEPEYITRAGGYGLTRGGVWVLLDEDAQAQPPTVAEAEQAAAGDQA